MGSLLRPPLLGWVLVAAAVAVAGTAVVLSLHSPGLPSGPLFLQGRFPERLSAALDLVDYVPVNVTTTLAGIHLTSDCRRITLAALPVQVQSVELGLAGRIGPRPNAHDLLREMFPVFNITLLQVRVERLEGDTYYARINLQQGSTILSLDARPSDAVALAVRFNQTVHANRKMLEKVGEGIC